MSLAELLPSLHLLPRADKLQLIQVLAADLAQQDQAGDEQAIILTPEDGCPYSPEELARMRREEGGRSLNEIWRSLGCA